jgi:PRTRC genetic system protein C
MIDAKVLSRSFTYNGVKLPDPDPRMTPEEVKAACSHQYPELATAAITGTGSEWRTVAVQLRQSDWDEGVN